jgi:hypothetical protein
MPVGRAGGILILHYFKLLSLAFRWTLSQLKIIFGQEHEPRYVYGG